MRTIDELGISKTPWSVNLKHPGYVLNADENVVVKELSGMDASLIAAAPDLYRSLREAVIESCVSYCGEHPIHCHKKNGECFVQKWRDVLAKASGEEAE